jgi:hypothetical protein
MEQFIELAIVTLVSSGVGSYLGAYLKKKGENLATHEDIDKLVVEVSAVTKATKEIESKITSDVWDRQKRWELKREVLFEATKKIAPVQNALTKLHAAYQLEKECAVTGKPRPLDVLVTASSEWQDAVIGLDQATLLVALTCQQDVKSALLAFGLFTKTLATEIFDGRPEVFLTSLAKFVDIRDDVTTAMRKEIEIDKL